MISTLNRYIMKEQIVPVILCLVGVTFVLVTGRLLQLTRYIFTSSFTMIDIVELMGLAMPKLMLFAFPMALLLGVLLAFLRMNSDNEIIALRAAGISFTQLMPSVFALSFLITAISFYNAVYVIPHANKAFDYKLKSLARAGLPILLREGTFITTIPGLTFFFRSVSPAELTIRGVFVQDQRQENVRATIIAEKARIVYQRDVNYLTFKISNGVITRVAENLQNAQAVSFKSYDLTLSLDELFNPPERHSKPRREMTLTELLEVMRQPPGGDKDVSYALEFHIRLAFPASCVFLGLMGAPLGAMFFRRGRMSGITCGIAVFLIYYVVFTAGRGLGENHLLPPFLAIWLPNILCLLVMGYIWSKVHSETPYKMPSFITHLRSEWKPGKKSAEKKRC